MQAGKARERYVRVKVNKQQRVYFKPQSPGDIEKRVDAMEKKRGGTVSE